MPTVAIDGQFRFVENTRENSYEPPHVHVWVGNEDVVPHRTQPGNLHGHSSLWELQEHNEGLCQIRRGDQKNVGRHSWRLGNDGSGLGQKRQPDDDGRQPAGGWHRSQLRRWLQGDHIIPYADVPELKERGAVSSLELPNPYEMVVWTDSGKQVEIHWDFDRHYCDASYPPTIEAIAMQGRQTLGARIRDLRESAGMTQEALARAADIGRVTLVRVEKGEQSPRFRTLDAIARALGIRIAELLVEPDRLLQ